MGPLKVITKEILDNYFPGIIFGGSASYKSVYSTSRLRAEHGSAYAMFNAPDPINNPGNRLPLGYFISRVFSLFSNNGFHKIDKYTVFFYNLNAHSVFHRGNGSSCSSSDNPFEQRDTVVRHENLNIDRIISRATPAGSYKKTTFREITRYACKAFIINNEFCCKPLNESPMSSFVHLLYTFQIDLPNIQQYVCQS